MARGVYVDCFSGASGDMLLGALLDAGVPVDALRQGLATLPVSGWQLDAKPAQQHGLHGTRARVRLEAHEHEHTHRGLGQVLAIIDFCREECDIPAPLPGDD